MTDPAEIARIAAGLTTHERDLLLGRCDGWGSWMLEAGSHLCSLGLSTKRDGSIQFDTPAALAVRRHLQQQKPSHDRE